MLATAASTAAPDRAFKRAAQLAQDLTVPADAIREWGRRRLVGVRRLPCCHPTYRAEDVRRIVEESTVGVAN
jgi:hypothetical protein